jgi:hypothetical protein
MNFQKEGRDLTQGEFEQLTGVQWAPQLDFDPAALSHIQKEALKLHKKGEMPLEQLWLGRYFHKEISSRYTADVAIRWIDPVFGWGVFALRDLKKMQFIAEYTGKVRKRKKEDEKNAYCFEYAIVPGVPSPYNIDALEQGALARYINHSDQPNLHSALATFDQISHVVLYTKEPIAKGIQLCYDYGPDYWSKRTAPLSL